MSLKRSDVVITRPGTMEEYRRFRATVLGWGFLPEPDRRGLPPHEEMMRDVDEAHRCDVIFQGRVELDADWMGMIDYDAHFMESVVRDINNQPAVTWWEHTYKGHPSYYFCTNSPHYREYLMYQIRRVLATGTDWLMIDSAIPTIAALNSRYGGCFCEHCLEGFQSYLKETLSPEQFTEHGIQEISGFNYREFLLERGVTDDVYRAGILAFPPKIPLADDYFNYQWREMHTLFRGFKRYAQELSDDYMPMSSNSPYYWPEFMYAVDVHDFYTNEMEYQSADTEIFPTQPIYTFKLADARKRLVAITGIPRAFEPYRINDKPGHIRLWIAQAYAFGHVFMVPTKMWTHRFKGEPDRWYYSKPGDYEATYHFIRDYPELFDDYESVASVALVFQNKAVRQHLDGETGVAHRGGQDRRAPDTKLVEACIALTKANIPYRLIVAGDEWIEDELLKEDLSPYSAVIRFEPSQLDEKQEEKLKEAGTRLLTWSDADSLLSHLEKTIGIDGAEGIIAFPRYFPDKLEAPTICHLLNTNYQIDTDSYDLQQNFSLNLDNTLYGRTFSKATLYAAGHDPLKLPCKQIDNTTSITIPELDMWAILKLE